MRAVTLPCPARHAVLPARRRTALPCTPMRSLPHAPRCCPSPRASAPPRCPALRATAPPCHRPALHCAARATSAPLAARELCLGCPARTAAAAAANSRHPRCCRQRLPPLLPPMHATTVAAAPTSVATATAPAAVATSALSPDCVSLLEHTSGSLQAPTAPTEPVADAGEDVQCRSRVDRLAYTQWTERNAWDRFFLSGRYPLATSVHVDNPGVSPIAAVVTAAADESAAAGVTAAAAVAADPALPCSRAAALPCSLVAAPTLLAHHGPAPPVAASYPPAPGKRTAEPHSLAESHRCCWPTAATASLLLLLSWLCDSKDGISLFNLTSGASAAPAADANSAVRSYWTTRDAAARLAVRSHLPSTERARFSQYKSEKTLYDAVVARYSSPATDALSRLMLSYLFPDLAAFATVADLITHLRTSDIRYRAALPAEC
ncbi:unnamed protein product [Closterium sp. NIES-53]